MCLNEISGDSSGIKLWAGNIVADAVVHFLLTASAAWCSDAEGKLTWRCLQLHVYLNRIIIM